MIPINADIVQKYIKCKNANVSKIVMYHIFFKSFKIK